MAAGGHFGWPKITFDRICRHFRSIRNFYFFFTKCLPTAVLDDRKSLFWSHFSPFQINNTQLLFFNFVFTKWLPAAILDDRKSLSNAFLAISDQYATLFCLNFFKMAAILEVPFGPFWMTENHFRSHFSPFQINTQLFFLNFFFQKSDLRKKQ